MLNLSWSIVKILWSHRISPVPVHILRLNSGVREPHHQVHLYPLLSHVWHHHPQSPLSPLCLLPLQIYLSFYLTSKSPSHHGSSPGPPVDPAECPSFLSESDRTEQVIRGPLPIRENCFFPQKLLKLLVMACLH
ncbi:hypothetical protein ATANTOWER_010428 [Ataeniobius toweri]|uniref:Uncharacterized protein n=1 Tax=Ataeniobius toweri TaxID=208326 RepID=A0ABU7AND4_9TELE|nr:hypothetical protein [Ataeniobius toweri]